MDEASAPSMDAEDHMMAAPLLDLTAPLLAPSAPLLAPSAPLLAPSAPLMAPSAPMFDHEEEEYVQDQYEHDEYVQHHYEQDEYVDYEEYAQDEHYRAEYEEHVSAHSTHLYNQECKESEIELSPFTDHQLLRLYHNVELEKNQEFVNHWLQTQENLERFELDELLVNYQRVRMNLLTTQKQLKALSTKVDELQGGLWTLSKEKIEEEGECEDGVPVIATRDQNLAEFNEDTAKALRTQFNQSRDLFAENLALFNFRSELCRIKVDDFVHSVFERILRKGVEKGPSVYTPQEELRMTVSILFKYLRKDLQDVKLVKDLKIWLDRAIGVVLVQSTLYDHLFILNHLMRCPAGVGIWGACFLQPSVPTVDPEDSSFENPFLGKLVLLCQNIQSYPGTRKFC